MSDDRESKRDWYIPPDWAFIIGWQVIAILWLVLLSWLWRAKRQGDFTPLVVALLLGLAGIVLLFFAKLPLYRQGRFLTFGPKTLPSSHRKFYWWAYVCIGASVLLMLGLL